ncbi:helix-turn-helix domain-containing protein [Nocardiopsis dassonvillei]|uniref:helix-turn-helix domain-containing protein n=1 Tax=Nocardiopsis dassonvillei TaxID=2014 RepID=UPI00157DC82C|nr:winged helix-turn-helix domain-containing protein [Nocardiopsis dassonvillei]
MDAQEKQQRRLAGAALFEQGNLRDSEISTLLEVSPSAVGRWHHAYDTGGTQALLSKRPSGPAGYLEESQRHTPRQVLRRGAKDYGFTTDSWTLARIRRVIFETFGVVYADLSGVWRLLRAMG